MYWAVVIHSWRNWSISCSSMYGTVVANISESNEISNLCEILVRFNAWQWMDWRLYSYVVKWMNAKVFVRILLRFVTSSRNVCWKSHVRVSVCETASSNILYWERQTKIWRPSPVWTEIGIQWRTQREEVHAFLRASPYILARVRFGDKIWIERWNVCHVPHTCRVPVCSSRMRQVEPSHSCCLAHIFEFLVANSFRSHITWCSVVFALALRAAASVGHRRSEKLSRVLCLLRVCGLSWLPTAALEQDWNKGFSDEPTVQRRRRNGPWPHPKMSVRQKTWTTPTTAINGGI